MTITVCAYNRPDYLQRVLTSLDVALIACPEYARDCTVWIGVDPGGDQYEQVLATATNWAICVPWRVQIIRWPEHLGVSEAPRRLLQHVFSGRQSTYNVHLEDDTVLSPDALRLAWWHHTAGWRHAEDSFLSLYSSLATLHPIETELTGNHAVVWRKDFGVWGWACSHLMWRLWLSQYWNEKLDIPTGWDWSASRMMRRYELWAVQPVLSRVRNIGRLGGVHETPETWDREHAGTGASVAGPDQMCEVSDFRLVGHRPKREAWAHGN